VENQGVLLEQRERTVLEDSLVTALAQQIHSRVLAAKDLVDQMDADTRSKPMSSGMAVGIRWVGCDKLTDQQAQVSRLLDRDAGAGWRRTGRRRRRALPGAGVPAVAGRARRSLERTGGMLTGRISVANPDDAERKAIIEITRVHQPAGTKRLRVSLAALMRR
jgi:hypothetical protein